MCVFFFSKCKLYGLQKTLYVMEETQLSIYPRFDVTKKMEIFAGCNQTDCRRPAELVMWAPKFVNAIIQQRSDVGFWNRTTGASTNRGSKLLTSSSLITNFFLCTLISKHVDCSVFGDEVLRRVKCQARGWKTYCQNYRCVILTSHSIKG